MGIEQRIHLIWAVKSVRTWYTFEMKKNKIVTYVLLALAELPILFVTLIFSYNEWTLWGKPSFEFKSLAIYLLIFVFIASTYVMAILGRQWAFRLNVVLMAVFVLLFFIFSFV